MAQNQELRLQTGVSTPSSGVAKLWVNQSGVVNVTSSAGTTTVVGGGKKVYRALLTQTGQIAPTAVVLENSLGGDIVWTRGSLGYYTGTLNGAFTQNKTFCHTTPIADTADSWISFAGIQRNSLNDIIFFTTDADNITALSDNGINGSYPVEITVYS